jgi:hypothetical protein
MVQFVVVICSFIAIGSLLSGKLSDTRFNQWVGRRFSQFSELNSAGDVATLAMSRGAPINEAWNNMINSPMIMIFGAGFGVEQVVAVYGGAHVVLLDCEILQIWQIGGIFVILLYAALLISLWIMLRPRNWPTALPQRITAASARVVLVGGVMLMWGHFFLMNFHSSQAPVGYWCWSTLGLALAMLQEQTNTASAATTVQKK